MAMPGARMAWEVSRLRAPCRPARLPLPETEVEVTAMRRLTSQ